MINLLTYLVSIFKLSKIDVIETPVEHTKNNILQDIKLGYNHFKKGKIFVAITVNDALLLSGHSLANIYIPVYLYDTNQMYLYPVFLFIKTLGFYVSTISSEKIISMFKNNLTIFKVDYILNFVALLVFVITKNFHLYLFMLFFVTIPQGVTGVLYEPIAFSEYKHEYLSRIATYISFIFSISTLFILIINIALLKYNIIIDLYDVMVYYLIINLLVILIALLSFKKATIKLKH
jgi:hypothetical protein